LAQAENANHTGVDVACIIDVDAGITVVADGVTAGGEGENADVTGINVAVIGDGDATVAVQAGGVTGVRT
jgi:hypothetical protein